MHIPTFPAHAFICLVLWLQWSLPSIRHVTPGPGNHQLKKRVPRSNKSSRLGRVGPTLRGEQWSSAVRQSKISWNKEIWLILLNPLIPKLIWSQKLFPASNNICSSTEPVLQGTQFGNYWRAFISFFSSPHLFRSPLKLYSPPGVYEAIWLWFLYWFLYIQLVVKIYLVGWLFIPQWRVKFLVGRDKISGSFSVSVWPSVVTTVPGTW